MDTRKILAGTIIWTLGLFAPMFYHTQLIRAAAQESAYSYSYHNMVKYFFNLPWPVWPYMIAMAITGSLLVIAGLKNKETKISS